MTKLQTAVFLAGALLMVVGAGLNVVQVAAAPYVFAVGALCFAPMQLLQRYEGTNFVVRRLRRIMIVSDVLFLVAALLMMAGQGNPLRLDIFTYTKYVHNNWVVVLLIAAILQLYTSHRMTHELEKEAKKL